MLGLDLPIWIALGVGIAGFVAKKLWPKRSKDIQELQDVFQEAWETAEGYGLVAGLKGEAKEEAYLQAVHKALEVRGIKPKNWMKDAAVYFGRQKSLAAKVNAVATGGAKRL